MVAELLKLGLLAEDSSGLGELISQFRHTPHQIVNSVLMRAHSLPLPENVDAWVVRVSEEMSEVSERFLDSLNESDVPYLLVDAGAERANLDSLNKKIFEAVVSKRHGISAKTRPARVWVLAASAGGPEAVIGFLELLDQSAKQDAFIYAQHIDAHALPVLISSVEAKSFLSVSRCESGEFIEAGTIYVVDPEHAFGMTDSGRFVMTGKDWYGVYKPSINQVIAIVARYYRARSGAVVFSGMGDDGADSCRLMQAVGGVVMTQSLDTCAVDSMPRVVNDSVDVVLSGTIEQLAQKVSESTWALK